MAKRYICHGREFDARIPVHVWTRYVLRADLAKHMSFKRQAVALILREAIRCGVTVHALAVLDNHVHMIVSQGRVDWEDRRRRGISPFMRNWKSVLSRHFRLLGLSGSKFEAPFQSSNLLTLEQYACKYAYVLGQALRHHAREEEVVISRAILSGDMDGIAAVVPELFDGVGARQSVLRFGRLVREVIDNARAIADGEAVKLASGTGSRRKRRALEQRRERRRSQDRQRDRVRAMVPEHWWEAAQAALWNWGLGEQETATLEWLPLSRLGPRRWAVLAERWRAFRMPELEVLHVRDRSGRVMQTRVVGGDSVATIDWTLRMAGGLERPPPR